MSARIDAADDSDERTRLEWFHEAVGLIGQQIVTNALTNLSTRGI